MEIILKIKGKEERLSPSEAKELFLQLKEIFEPMRYAVYPSLPHPYSPPPWLRDTGTDATSAKTVCGEKR